MSPNAPMTTIYLIITMEMVLDPMGMTDPSDQIARLFDRRVRTFLAHLGGECGWPDPLASERTRDSVAVAYALTVGRSEPSACELVELLRQCSEAASALFDTPDVGVRLRLEPIADSGSSTTSRSPGHTRSLTLGDLRALTDWLP